MLFKLLGAPFTLPGAGMKFIFNQIADLLEIQGANPFRVRAYRRGAIAIQGLTDPVESIAQQGTLRDITGIGEDLANKINEYLQTGKLEFHERLKEEVPPALVKLVDIPSVGPKTAKQIYDQFRVLDIEELEALCKTDKLLSVAGFKQKSIDNILRGIEVYRRRKGNYLLGRAVPNIADYIHIVVIVVIVVSMIPIVVEILRERRRRAA